MKLSEQHLVEARREHAKAVVARHACQLFERLPILSGFWLRSDFKVAELSFFIWPGRTTARDLYDQVTESLVELANEYPEVVQLMSGRTIARAVH
jgi:hypothetical protein